MRLRRRLLAAACATAILIGAASPAAAQICKGTLYLTIDTGTMSHAELVAEVLRKHAVKATFFLANERTSRGDHALDESWAAYWRRLAADGHAFGSHTWRHWYFRGDSGDAHIRYVPWGSKRAELLDKPAFCTELQKPAKTFEKMTGQPMSMLWRAPGGYTTARSLQWARDCGFTRHVRWAAAGFLGDELPSDKYPNEALLKRALRTVKDGDILVMHLGIRSRKDPFQPMLDPLIRGFKKRGYCFATLTESGS